MGRCTGADTPGEGMVPSPHRVEFNGATTNRFWRIEFEGADVLMWHVGGVKFFKGDARVRFGGPFSFTSAWMSAGAGEEWVSVDLGAPCTFDRVNLSWIRRAAEGFVQVSDDGNNWKSIQPLVAGTTPKDEFKLASAARGRWVRVLMTKPVFPEGYTLSELEVWGRGGPVPVAHPAPPVSDGRLRISGGNWRVQRDSLVKEDGAALSRVGYRDEEWVIATVPATVLSSYWNAGALPDPNFGDNINTISDSFFYADFWYRNEFMAPDVPAGKKLWLDFDGINWKADVFLNGEKLGRIEGGFMRARFDVTGRLREGQRNAIAVRIEKNASPGSIKEKTRVDPDKNGGVLGADNPTYHASIGWDWIPTIRGRNTGIWNDVWLVTTGVITIENPTARTLSFDASKAEVQVETVVRNSGSQPVGGTLRGTVGGVAFSIPATIQPGGTQGVKGAVVVPNPKLWWPNGYGDPYLYDVEMRFEANGAASDGKRFKTGIREWKYSEEGGKLRMWINGRRFVPRGGNWGFPESMLRYRGREYDVAVRYHRDLNFNMIRNWVGQTGDDEFYEACDRHGIVVWQDFWLANPWDGPDPDDNEMFMRNARDTVNRIRSHPSLGLYCGRNEGYPPKVLEQGLRDALAELHPGMHYISSSADDVVSGHGPYRAQPLKLYFSERATPMFHSEMGMPNILTYDSLKATMPESAMWPQGDVWGHHDFSLKGAQGAESFIARINQSYGGANSAEEWVNLAQFVNYEGYRAMFEAQSKNRMGLLIWMSHPSWPSFVWQTYDYFFEPTAAYFGARKASEPLHIQWNPVTDNVEVVNYNAGNAAGLTAAVEVLNMDGSVKWSKSATLDAAEDSNSTPIQIEWPSDLSATHFVRMRLTQGGKAVSENFYWRGVEDANFKTLRDLPKVKLNVSTRAEHRGNQWRMTTELSNPAKSPALMVRLKPVRDKSGDRILPALFSDNYIAVMPGEKRTITTEVESADARGEKPRMVVEGFNVH
jgi:beta-galactosidase/beta-glucuronidase